MADNALATASIVTLTLNAAIDGSSEAETVRHTRKVRTVNERYDPGGGGINVARVVKRLGGRAHAVYLAGGVTGVVLDDLLDRHGLDRTRLDIADQTRTSLSVHERSSGREYRFVPEGPQVTRDEWEICLKRLADIDCEYLVASGSLPRGVPDDFYLRLRQAIRPEVRFVVDTSGEALRQVLSGGGVFLVKPSLGEMEQLAGRSLADRGDLLRAAAEVVERGAAEHVAVTLGKDGALLVGKEGALSLPPIPVEAKSAVGAGDSFVAGMTFAFAAGQDRVAAFRQGVAAGTAAVLTPGTDLCHREDVERLLETMPWPDEPSSSSGPPQRGDPK